MPPDPTAVAVACERLRRRIAIATEDITVIHVNEAKLLLDAVENAQSAIETVALITRIEPPTLPYTPFTQALILQRIGRRWLACRNGTADGLTGEEGDTLLDCLRVLAASLDSAVAQQ